MGARRRVGTVTAAQNYTGIGSPALASTVAIPGTVVVGAGVLLTGKAALAVLVALAGTVAIQHLGGGQEPPAVTEDVNPRSTTTVVPAEPRESVVPPRL